MPRQFSSFTMRSQRCIIGENSVNSRVMQPCTAIENGTATPIATLGSALVRMANAVPITPPITTLGGWAPASGTIPIHTSSSVPPTSKPV